MTSHRNSDLVFECDECGQYEEGLDPHNFVGEWEELKATKGWRCFPKDGGGWNHFCRDCVKDWGRRQREQRPGAVPNKQREAVGQARSEWRRNNLQRPSAPNARPSVRPARPGSRPASRRNQSDETPPWE